MPSDELTEWIAYHNIEPFGEARQDLRNAIACCLFASAHRGKGTSPTIEDYMVDTFLHGKPEQSESDFARVMGGLMNKFGSKVD